MPGKGGGREQTIPQPLKTIVADLLALRDWLVVMGVTLVGMESAQGCIGSRYFMS